MPAPAKSKAIVRRVEAPRLSVLAGGVREAEESAAARVKAEAAARKQQLRKALPPSGTRRGKSRAEASVGRKIREARARQEGGNPASAARPRPGHGANDARAEGQNSAQAAKSQVEANVSLLSAKLQQEHAVINKTHMPTSSGLSAAERAAVSEVWVDQMLGHGQSREATAEIEQRQGPGADNDLEPASSINSKARRYLRENGLDRGSLESLGLRKEEIDRMYRAMYVYSIGFHQCVSDIVKQSSVAHPELVGRIWRTYSRLLELSERGNSNEGVAALERNHLIELKAAKARLEQTEEAWRTKFAVSQDEATRARAEAASARGEVAQLECKLQESREELALARLATEQEASRHVSTAKELDVTRQKLAQLNTQLREAAIDRAKMDATLVQARDEIAAAEKRAQDAALQRQRACQRAEDARADADQLQANLIAESAKLRETEAKLAAQEEENARLLAQLEEQAIELQDRKCSETTRVKQLRELRFERSRLQRLLAEEGKKFQDSRAELDAEIVEHSRACEELNRVSEEFAHAEKALQTVSKEHASLQERAAADESKLGATQRLNKEYREELERATASVATMGAELDAMASKFEAETKLRLKVEEALRKRTMELATSVDNLAQAKRGLNSRADEAKDARKRISALENKLTVERANGQDRARRSADEIASLRKQVADLHVQMSGLERDSGNQLEAAQEREKAREKAARADMEGLRQSLEVLQHAKNLLYTEVEQMARGLGVSVSTVKDCVRVRDAVEACLAREADYRERLAASEKQLSGHAEALKAAQASIEAKADLVREVERLERDSQDLRDTIASLREDLRGSQALVRELTLERAEAQAETDAAEKRVSSFKSRLEEAQAHIRDLEKDRESVAKHSDELLESMTAEIEHVSALKSANIALEAELQSVLSSRPRPSASLADAATQVDVAALSTPGPS